MHACATCLQRVCVRKCITYIHVPTLTQELMSHDTLRTIQYTLALYILDDRKQTQCGVVSSQQNSSQTTSGMLEASHVQLPCNPEWS